MSTPDLSVILNGHREGTLAHHTLRTLHRALRHAHEAGLRLEVVVVLDNADDATCELMSEAAGPEGYLRDVADARIVDVAVADLGLARNRGVAEARAPHIALLDADNLPSLRWFTEAHRIAAESSVPCVVHPEALVIFEGRQVIWPQWSSQDERFRVENFYDQNYWDAFCLASREVFEHHPYTATGRASGFGPEDWHWNMEVVRSGVPHIAAPGTWLFYRAKLSGSLMGAHRAEGNLVHASPLLTDPGTAAAVLDEARRLGDPPEPPRRTRLLRRLVRESAGRKARARLRREEMPPEPMTTSQELMARLRGGFVVPSHYRYFYDAPGLDDAQAVQHFRNNGRRAGRRGWLRAAELASLHPDRFRVHHYRALHSDVVDLTPAEAREHFLTVGLHERRRARLTLDELRDLSTMDLDDYRDRYSDLAGHSDNHLVQHYLEWGRAEQRRTSYAPGEREYLRSVTIDPDLDAEWRTMHTYEPWVEVPTETRLADYRWAGPPADGSLSPGSGVWWQVIAALEGRRPDVIFVAPWVRMGGGDLLLARYARTMRRLAPEQQVLVVTTHGTSTRPDLLGDDVTFIDLPAMGGYGLLTHEERERLVAMLVAQLRPRVLHVFNAPEAFDAVQRYWRAMSAHTHLFLSTFAIDYGPEGELYSPLARRPAGFLDPIARVIVDNNSIVEEFHTLFHMDRSRFAVHHQPVDLPPRRPWTERRHGAPLRVMWAARFDRQKRLDLLADVAEAAANAGIVAEWHVYGAPVIGSADDSRDSVERLETLGATFHGTYDSLDDLPLDETDLFLLTSENEGIPLTLLDVMARRVPVMAPLVGGVRELVSTETGWPITRFDDVDAYVSMIAEVAHSRQEAERRADAAYQLLADEFSWSAFDRRVAETPHYLPD